MTIQNSEVGIQKQDRTRKHAQGWKWACGVLAVIAVMMALGGAVTVVAAQAQPPRVDEFVPISELPPQDQLPAAPLLVAAYVIVLLVFFVYVFSIARRLSVVQQELRQLQSSIGRSRRE